MKQMKHVLAIGAAALVAMASAVPLAEAGHGFGGGGFGGHGFGGGGFGGHGFGGGGFGGGHNREMSAGGESASRKLFLWAAQLKTKYGNRLSELPSRRPQLAGQALRQAVGASVSD